MISVISKFFQSSLASHSRTSADRPGRFELQLAELRAGLSGSQFESPSGVAAAASSGMTFDVLSETGAEPFAVG